MYKIYSRDDIKEIISDKVKSVEDLYNLPLGEFDRECVDFWFNDYVSDPEYQVKGYYPMSYSREMFYAAYYLIECVDLCEYLVLVHLDDSLYFVFDPIGLDKLHETLVYRREKLAREFCSITYLSNLLSSDEVYESGFLVEF